MFLQFIFIFSATLLLITILVLYFVKAGLQLQYIRISKGKDPGSITDFVHFDYTDAAERKERGQAFMLFPLMYGIDLEDKNELLLSIKRKVKRIHIIIYVILIVLIILGVYSEKVFTAND